ncbi:hypothetical protein T05_116, partial [Trichinella murrelli]
LKGLLYTGRNGLASTNIGQFVCMFVNSNRNVSMDRYFTSYYTVQHLLEHGLTAIAYLRKAAQRDPYSTLAVFEHNKRITMISYVPRKNSNVLLLISCYTKLKVDNQQGDKGPNIMND